MTTQLELSPTPSVPSPPAPRAEEPFYGWRYLRVPGANGKEELKQVPLTLEDVLHPQEDDEIPMRPLHFRECAYLKNCFQTRRSRLRGGWVSSDWLVDWNVPGVPNHQPDVAVFEGLKILPSEEAGTLRLAVTGGWCLLGVEIVSPDRRNNDVVHKRREYYQAGVPHYVLVDQIREGGPRVLRHFRPGPAAYEEMPLDERGGVLLEALGLRLEMRDNQVICRDAATGEELLDYPEVIQAKQLAEQQARDATERERQEIVARQAAEEARRTAEERERREADARKAAEQRLGELEAELRRLRANQGGGPEKD